MPKRLQLICFLGLFSSLLNAQIVDNFMDGNFSANPIWQGNTDHFIVNSAKELQLNAPTGGNSMLVVAGEIADSAVWQIYFRLEFAPSLGNRLRVYLQADDQNLTIANGYFLEIGENGANDALRFFRQNAGQVTLLGSGTAASLAGDPSLARLKIIRKKGGIWQILADFSGNDAFLPQIEITDATFSGGTNRFFGFDCLFSASRKDKFFFDDVSILPDLPDQKPPKLLRAEPLDSQRIDVFFDEKLTKIDAENVTNFWINQNIGQPISAILQPSEKSIRLLFSNKLLDGKIHELTTKNISDALGNLATTELTTFFYLKISPAEPFDLLINEFMADPSPSIGLPEVEWVEILNRSAKTIDLQSITFSTGGAPAHFSTYLLRPDSLVLLVDAADTASFFLIKNKISTINFPAILNSADELVIADLAGNPLDIVDFDLSFYKNETKKDGGWSLERINPNLPCDAGSTNWSACKKGSGGTPAKQNSIFQATPDLVSPKLVSVFPQNSTTLRVQFSEGLAATFADDFSNFQIDPLLVVVDIFSEKLGSPFWTFLLADSMKTGVIYALKIAEKAVDCSANFFEKNESARFALPEIPNANDLIINELLFNPTTNEADFVELFNRSKKVINLENLFLGNINASGVDVKKLTVKSLIFPNEYAVFTSDSASVFRNFFVENPRFLHQNTIPNFADDAGNVQIYRQINTSDIEILDDLNYSKTWHHALLTDDEKENRSLERLRPSDPTDEPSNWQTAAASQNQHFGRGTPTAKNSQAETAQFVDNQWITVSNTRISPDGDGFEDFILIDLNLPSAGFSGRIEIFDEVGQRVKLIIGQALVGTNPRFQWDGELDGGGEAPIGIYVLRAEFLNVSTLKNLKKKMTLAVVRKW
jgi:hypothetical protein